MVGIVPQENLVVVEEDAVENHVKNHANLVEREENPVEKEKEAVEDAVN